MRAILVRPDVRPRVRLLVATAIAVAAATGCSDSPADPPGPADPEAVIEGTVAVAGGPVPEGLEVLAQWGSTEAGAPVESDGTFRLLLTSLPDGPGFLGVRPPSGGGTVPALVRLQDPAVPGELRIVLLPDRWTVRAGAHAGTEVPIRPAHAASGGVLPSFWGFTFPFAQDGRRQTVLDSTRWSGGLVTWPGTAFPLPVALDREGSSSDLAGADSLRLWAGLDRLEAVVGRDLFHPARLDELSPPEPDAGGIVPGAVVVRIDSTLVLRGRADAVPGEATWVRVEEVGSWSGSRVERLGVVSADARAGWMAFGSPAHLSDPSLVMHEAMHVLGVGHGCAWRSLQTYCSSLTAGEPTADDVAHFEVLEAARALEKELDTRLGILPAVFGHRALELGLSPLPDVEVVPPGEG